MAASSDAALIVFAWGNESRGDDAIGSILAARIIELDDPAINIVEDHQLNIEHVMDIVENVPVLFIDASVGIDIDYKLEKLAPTRDASISTHTISPVALLDLYEQTLGKSAPAAYLLHIRGESFELGEPISASSNESANKAWCFLQDLLARPRNEWGETLDAASSQ